MYTSAQRCRARHESMSVMTLASTCPTYDCVDRIRRAIHTFSIGLFVFSKALQITIKTILDQNGGMYNEQYVNN